MASKYPMPEPSRDRPVEPARLVVPPTPLRSMSLADLIAYEPPPRVDLVADLLPSGSFTSLVGPPKMGKSLFLIDMLASIALGEDFLGRPTVQAPVLLVPAEDHPRELKERILNRLNGRRDAEFHIIPPRGVFEGEPSVRMDKPEIMDRLITTCQTLGIEVLGLDPFREMHMMGENHSDDMAPLLRWPREIAHSLNIATILVHHASRGGEARGSTAIKGAVDQEFLLVPKGAAVERGTVAPEGVLRIDGRYAPKEYVPIKMGPNVRWARVEHDEGEEAMPSNLRGHVINLLRETPSGLTIDQMLEMLEIKKKTLQALLTQMVTDPDPPIRCEGRGVTNDPKRYFAVTLQDLFGDMDDVDETF